MPDYLEYRKSISRELMVIKDRVRSLIEDSNWGTEGRYKEVILMETLRSLLPSDILVGTGFVIGESNKKSKQIDIIVYKNNNPEIFKKGDFVIVEKNAVIGIIEVKSKIYNSNLEGIFEKAEENGEVIGKGKFNGIFAYETDIEFTKEKLDFIWEYKLNDYDGYINNIAFGENYFMKYWEKGMPDVRNSEPHISIYKINELAIGYFISNLIEDANIYTTGRKMSEIMYESLYPLPDGKESKRIYDKKL